MTASHDEHIDYALEQDAADGIADLALSFEMPAAPDGSPARYLCGHSLGLMPRGARACIDRELERWSRRGVGGHFDSGDGWFAVHERFAAPLAALLGCDASEVVVMNSLTVNLHLMFVSFFQPGPDRHRVLIERGAFPSDRYAVESQLRFHGLDPEHDLIEFESGDGGVGAAELDATLAAAGGSVALVLLPGVQYLTGAAVDLAACAAAARRHGCRIGFDLAHAIGNVEIDLRASEPDFAVWCSYKYLNGGPGAIGGCFVNRRWIASDALPRFEGWWGHDKSSRFAPARKFSPIATAEAWQISNPPVLAMMPLEASLELFTTAGSEALRSKSIALTGYLEWLLESQCGDRIELLTPRDPAARGAQLSIRLRQSAPATESLVARLLAGGVYVDWRAPNVLRMAPVPLYNSFADVHASVRLLAAALSA